MPDSAGAQLSVGDRLDDTRRQRFVGRNDHRDLFRGMLRGVVGAPALLYVFGPGGIGKTTLLDCLVRDAREFGARTIKIDGRTTAAAPAAILQELRTGLGIPAEDDPINALREQDRIALFFDTYEYLNPIDDWIHNDLITSLPANVSTVIAGRTPPPEERRNDSGWSELAAFVSLRNLGPDDVRRYLELRNVPSGAHERVLHFTHGHPLALSMVAEIFLQHGGSIDEIEIDRPDLIHALMERLLRNEPDQERLRALEVAAQSRFTTIDLLRSVLDDGREQEHFRWLRDLAFMEHGAYGLFPHDLARDVIERDLRWRSPEQALNDHRAIRNWYVRLVQEGSKPEQYRAAFDLLYLHRHQPTIRPLLEGAFRSSAWLEPAMPEDLDYCRELVRSMDGPTSAKLVDYWFARQREGFLIVRSGSKRRLGFLASVIPSEDRSDAEHDPAVSAIFQWIDRYGPLRPGEVVWINRFSFPDHAQPHVQHVGMAGMWSIVQWLTTLNAGWSFVVNQFPEVTGETLAYARFRVCGPDITSFERPNRLFGHDWRIEPQARWFELMLPRELGLEDDATSSGSNPLLVLSEKDFRDAVRDALRVINRPGRLIGNPLLQSRLVSERGDPGPSTLQALLREAAATLALEPRDRRFAAALDRAYLNPAETHEQAAESLDLPYSTFRLHLTTAVQRVTEYLWNLELRSEWT